MTNPKAGKNRPQNWRTPRALFLELERRFSRGGFTLDIAADDANTKCCRYFTEKESALDDADWSEPDGSPARAFGNPPLKDLGPWVAKAHSEVEEGNAEVVVLLLPVRTGSGWFHDYCLPYAYVEFLRGRVSFEDPSGAGRSAPFEDSMVVVFSKPLAPGAL